MAYNLLKLKTENIDIKNGGIQTRIKRDVMKFRGHQSFHLKESWLHKGLQHSSKNSKLFFSSDKAMAELGVGKNMVDAIRYWLKATKLTEENKDGVFLTELAELFLNKDPYFELDGTLFLVQYLVATNKTTATTWYWFFNYFSAQTFDTESLTNSFHSYIQLKTEKVVQSDTLEKDLQCLLKMYTSVEYNGKQNPETENPSIFSKYNWLKKQKDGKYMRNKINVHDFNLNIFCYLLYIFWKNDLNKPESIGLKDITEKICSPGKVFQFSLEEGSELIDRASKNTNYLNYSRSGGYFIIHLKEKNIKNALHNYYKETCYE